MGTERETIMENLVRRRPIVGAVIQTQVTNDNDAAKKAEIEADLKELAIIKMKLTALEKREKALTEKLSEFVPAYKKGKLSAQTIFGDNKVEVVMERVQKSSSSINKKLFIEQQGVEMFCELGSITAKAITDTLGKVTADKYKTPNVPTESVKVTVQAI